MKEKKVRRINRIIAYAFFIAGGITAILSRDSVAIAAMLMAAGSGFAINGEVSIEQHP